MPSGIEGKSKNVDSYEHEYGFGHEEWLLDMEKLIDGYHYGYLQSLSKAHEKHQGKVFNISLYTINSLTKERWWIGKIKDAKVISKQKAIDVLEEYQKKGWFKEMLDQLSLVGANSEHFGVDDPYGFVNIKFKPENIDLLPTPLRFSHKDPAVPSTYYVLLDKKTEPNLEIPIKRTIVFSPGHNEKKSRTKAKYPQREREVDLMHNRMQTDIYNQLVREYGEGDVGTELPLGEGTTVDVVVRKGDSYVYYEIKTANSIRICIREALGQLMEYGFWSKEECVEKIVIVSQNYITKDAEDYLRLLKSEFNIPVKYVRYDCELKKLIQK